MYNLLTILPGSHRAIFFSRSSNIGWARVEKRATRTAVLGADWEHAVHLVLPILSVRISQIWRARLADSATRRPGKKLLETGLRFDRVPRIAGNDMNVCVFNSLAGGAPVIDCKIEACWKVLFLKQVLYVSHEFKAVTIFVQ
jgi:hypothetical protein